MSASASTNPKSDDNGRWWARPALLLGLVVVLLVLAHVFDAGQRLRDLRDWIDTLGPWGPLVFICVYAAATIFAVPGTALTVSAGGLFGAVLGVIAVSIASTVGAALCFLIARYFAREQVEKKVAESKRFRKLDRLTEQQGHIIVAITRLVPIFPYNFLNYAFGLTRVRFWTYVFWSWICMLPMTIVYVVGADAIVKGLQRGELPWALIAVIAVALVVLVFFARSARGKLRAAQEEMGEEQDGEEEREEPGCEVPELPYDMGQVEPRDEHNERLKKRTHPEDWQNPEPAACYNLVVIGAGSGGLVAAAGAAAVGAKVALVERHLTGGDCLNVGCVPSKAMIRSSRTAAEVRGADRYGVETPEGSDTDFSAVMERLRRVRSELSWHDSVQRFTDMGVDVFIGHGCFERPGIIRVGEKQVHYKKAIIATGARARTLPIPGLAEAGFLTNETVFWLTERPKRLVVIGSGPLGCELAQTFQRLGVHVTVLEKKAKILQREDPDAARVVQAAMQRDGVRFVFNAEAQKVDVCDGEKIVHVHTEHEEFDLPTDEILLATGRVPNVSGMGLAAVDVKHDQRHGVQVDERLRTTNPDIYAVGDACLKYKFTHMADATARLAVQNALFHGRGQWTDIVVPWCTYTDPEIAHVGMYKEDAEQKGIETETITVPMDDTDRAVLDGEAEGMLKVLVKRGSDKILGATLISAHAGESISELTVAIVGDVGLKRLASTVHPYPTQAEVIKKAADAYNKKRLTPRILNLMDYWLTWQRGERLSSAVERHKS